MNKEKLKKHLEERQNQLDVLIKLLESQGTKHPQYNQLFALQQAKASVDSQLERLEKLM